MSTFIADTIVDEGHLVGGKHKTSGKVVFPMPSGAEGASFEPVHLSQTGTLWSWSVQRFLPKSPPYMGTETLETFKPYVFGYVELPGEVIVQSRIVGVSESDLKIGMALKFTLIDFEHKEKGTVKTYAFTPA